MEEWKPVPLYETWYEVSSLGRVRSLDRVVYAVSPHTRNIEPRRYGGKILRPRPAKNGYLVVTLSKSGARESFHVHRLVALAFLGFPPPDMQILHGNGDQQDNRLVNLRYDTIAENFRDKARHREERRKRESK